MAPLKGQEVLKFHKHSYLENRIFDHRLVKDNLLDKWPTADMNEYNERKDHRNLMESYVPLTTIAPLPLPIAPMYCMYVVSYLGIHLP